MIMGGILVISAVCSLGICWGAGLFSSLWWLLWLPLSFLGCVLTGLVLAFLFLWLLSICVDLNKPPKHDSKLYRTAANLYLGLFRTLLQMRVHTTGLEQTPKEGRFFLVCNHINDMDPLTLMMYFPKSQLAFITKRENLQLFVAGKMMFRLMCQPLNRENDREALKTILSCVKLIQQDEVSIGAFPEGYTSRDGLFHGFRHGVFKVAQKTKVPIVVCTLKNTNRIFKNAARLRPTDVELHLIAVIPPEEYEGLSTVELGERIHKLMSDDLGPALVAAE